MTDVVSRDHQGEDDLAPMVGLINAAEAVETTLQAGMDLLHAAGMDHVRLIVDAESATRADHLYFHYGFTPLAEWHVFARVLAW